MTKIPESTRRKLVLGGIENIKMRKDCGFSRVFKDQDVDLITTLTT